MSFSITNGRSILPAMKRASLALAAFLFAFLFACLPLRGQSQINNGSSGSLSLPTSVSPAMGLYFTNTCPVANTSQCFFTAANTQVDSTASWASTGNTITITDGLFQPSDVGKRVAGYKATSGQAPLTGCIADRIAFGALTTGSVTIASYVSANQVTLSSNPADTVASGGCFIWGTPDDTTASAFETAYAATTAYCPRVMLASANYWFSSPHFYSQPLGCQSLPSLVAAQSSFGNLILPQGFELEGRGPGATQIYLGPDFPNGDGCAHQTGGGDSGCFAVPLMGKFTDFGISGGGQSTCQVANNVNLFVANVATLQNLTFTNMCFGTSGNTNNGIVVDQLVQMYQVNNSGWGNTCLVSNSPGWNQGYKVVCENAPVSNLTVNAQSAGVQYGFQCFGCFFDGSAQAAVGGSNIIFIASGAVARLFGTEISSAPVPGFTTTGSSLIQNHGGTLYCDQCYESATSGQFIVGYNGTLSGANAYVSSSIFTSGSGGAGSVVWEDVSGDSVYDLGGNNFGLASTGGFQPTNPIVDGHMLKGACTGTATSSSTLGLYGTGPNETATTCTSTTLGSGVVMTQGRTLATLQVTATHVGVSASSGVVTVLRNGVATTITCTIGTATSCHDFAHTVAVSAGDLISIQFTTQASEVLAGVQASIIWE